MSDTPVVIEIPGLLRNKTVKKLTLSPSGLTIEKPLSFDAATFIPAESMLAFKYGLKGISGYAFNIGRRYLIDIRDNKGKTFTIGMTSLYSIRKKLYGDLWLEIVRKLWDYYFDANARQFYQLYANKERFDLAGLEFHPFGIKIGEKGLFWNEIGLSNYKSYFMVHHRENLAIKKAFHFKDDWNALLLQTILKAIVSEQNFYREQDPAQNNNLP